MVIGVLNVECGIRLIMSRSLKQNVVTCTMWFNDADIFIKDYFKFLSAGAVNNANPGFSSVSAVVSSLNESFGQTLNP